MSQHGSGAVRMGRWEIASVPANWWFVPEFGLKHNTAEQPASNITVKDDVLLAGNRLEPYIRVQMEILKGRYEGLAFAGPQKSTLYEANETMLLMIRHPLREGVSLLQVQTYVRAGSWLGIITLTTTERMLTSVRRDYEQFVASLKIAPPEDPAPASGDPA